MYIELFFSLFHLAYSGSEYGNYRFYGDTGGVYYDYSGNGYHAVNGQMTLPDSNDVLQTDRGAYFDGISSYIKLHNTE